MFLFDITSPTRDGSLNNEIPIHELGHGLSNRLTGGARNGRCLETTEAGSMGEGWSDALALMLTRTSKNTRNDDHGSGTYVLGEGKDGTGIRRFKYSTNLKTNPLLFSNLNRDTQVHDGGEIWATILNEVYWNLVDNLGFSPNWYDESQLKGNIVMMKIMIGGMMLQPCNPTFLQARDAIIQAEKNYYGGKYACDVWKGFAKRGMGVDAAQKKHVDGFKLPAECK
jgi:extracellular elastinolytic metalloproteinase